MALVHGAIAMHPDFVVHQDRHGLVHAHIVIPCVFERAPRLFNTAFALAVTARPVILVYQVCAGYFRAVEFHAGAFVPDDFVHFSSPLNAEAHQALRLGRH